jgi:hypothetical protein
MRNNILKIALRQFAEDDGPASLSLLLAICPLFLSSSVVVVACSSEVVYYC